MTLVEERPSKTTRRSQPKRQVPADGLAPEDRPSQNIKDFTEKITRWYRDDHQGFRTLYDATIRNVVPPPKDTNPNVYFDWSKCTKIEDLCEFFEEWYAWKPGVNSGLDYSAGSTSRTTMAWSS